MRGLKDLAISVESEADFESLILEPHPCQVHFRLPFTISEPFGCEHLSSEMGQCRGDGMLACFSDC